MPYRRIVTLATLLSGLLLSSQSHAIAYWGTYSSILMNSPAQYFTDDDWKQFEETMTLALDQDADRETRDWRNDKSGASGSFTVLRTLDREDRQCRSLKAIIAAKHLRKVLGMVLCKEEDGVWKVITRR